MTKIIRNGYIEPVTREPYLYEIFKNSQGVSWTDYGTGAGHLMDIDTNYGYVNNAALHIAIDIAAPAGDFARAGRYLPFAPHRIVDVDGYFAFQNDDDQTDSIQFRLVHIQNTGLNLYYPMIKYYPASGDLAYYNSGGTMTTFKSGYKIERFKHWHYFRFVVDMHTHAYKFFQIDKYQQTLNVSIKNEGVSTYLNLLKFDFATVTNGTSALNKCEMWLDEFRVYDYFRSQGRQN